VKTDETLQPLVSCIMPTYNRREFVSHAIRYFLRQDYANKELIIVDDGNDSIEDLLPAGRHIYYLHLDQKKTIGAKRNIACQEANGQIIVHWDDDDWMAPWRISYQVKHLLEEQADICGLNRLLFYEPVRSQSWQYLYPKEEKPWVAGGTLCYNKSFWKKNQFPDINVGEDGRFVWSDSSKKIVALRDNTFYVALIHKGNSSPKLTKDHQWYSYPLENLHNIIGEDKHYYEHPNNQKNKLFQMKVIKNMSINKGTCTTKKHSIKQNPIKPPVTCVLVTYNRRKFIPQAMKYFLRQDYPEKRLIILDDGTDKIEDLVPDLGNVEYIRLDRKLTIGEKRNIGIEASQGEIILFWDDDDWYGPNRISYQVEPIIEGNADTTVLQDGFVLDLAKSQFWICKPPLRDRMFAFGVIAGTIAFRKSLFNHKIRFADVSLAEDAEFLRSLYRNDLKITKMPAEDKFIYIRHKHNTWAFSSWQTFNNGEWQLVDAPDFMSSDDLSFYSLLVKKGRSENPVINRSQDKIKRVSKMLNQKEANIPLSVQGAMLYRKGAYSEALNCLERAARVESDNHWILFDKGLCFLALNQFTDAFNMLESARAKIPSNTWVWSALGITFARLGYYDRARHAFICARKISPENSEAALFLDGLSESNLAEGIREFKQEKYNSALTYLDAAIFKDPQNKLAHFYKGKTLLTLKQPSKALPYLLSADLLKPNQAFILLHIGYALIDLGYNEQAKLYLKRALALDSTCLEAQKTLDSLFQSKFSALLSRIVNQPNESSTGNLDFIKYLNTGSGSLFEDYIFLYGITRLLRPNLVLETGTNTGVSSIVFAKAMLDSNIGGKVVTVDYDKEVLKTAKTQIQAEGLNKFIEIYEGESLRVLPQIFKKYTQFDLCFLDGNHHYDIVKEEFEQVKQYCRYILFHDSQLFEGVKKFVEELPKYSDCQAVNLLYPPGEQWSEGQVLFRSNPGITVVEVLK